MDSEATIGQWIKWPPDINDTFAQQLTRSNSFRIRYHSTQYLASPRVNETFEFNNQYVHRMMREDNLMYLSVIQYYKLSLREGKLLSKPVKTRSWDQNLPRSRFHTVNTIQTESQYHRDTNIIQYSRIRHVSSRWRVITHESQEQTHWRPMTSRAIFTPFNELAGRD